MSLPFPVCDTHMHYWDTPRRDNGNLGDIRGPIPSYLAADYAADLEDLELDSVRSLRWRRHPSPHDFCCGDSREIL